MPIPLFHTLFILLDDWVLLCACLRGNKAPFQDEKEITSKKSSN